MKTFTTILLSGLFAVSIAQAESAAGVPCDKDGADSAQQRPDRQGKGERQGNRPSREQLLERFDSDGDGQLSDTERQAAREFRQQAMMLRRFDGDGDGSLSADEQAQADAFIAERQARVLERFDADGDGILSDEERQQARQAMRRHVQNNQSKHGGQRGPNRSGPPRSDEMDANLPAPPNS